MEFLKESKYESIVKKEIKKQVSPKRNKSYALPVLVHEALPHLSGKSLGQKGMTGMRKKKTDQNLH